MEEILLGLICNEFEIEEDFLFSKAQFDDILNAISMMSYILIVKYKVSPSDVHRFYVKKGWPKSRASIYNQLKRAENNINKWTSYRELKNSLEEGVEIALSQEIIKTDNTDVYSIKGRVVSKIMSLKDIKSISRLEDYIDILLKSEFVTTGQFGEKKTETWLT